MGNHDTFKIMLSSLLMDFSLLPGGKVLRVRTSPWIGLALSGGVMTRYSHWYCNMWLPGILWYCNDDFLWNYTSFMQFFPGENIGWAAEIDSRNNETWWEKAKEDWSSWYWLWVSWICKIQLPLFSFVYSWLFPQCYALPSNYYYSFSGNFLVPKWYVYLFLEVNSSHKVIVKLKFCCLFFIN